MPFRSIQFIYRRRLRGALPYFCRNTHHSSPLSFATQAQFKPKHGQPFEPVDSQLGLRSNLPPDSQPEQNGGMQPLSDQDWEIRTGRAIYVLQRTLPEFFQTGLITSIDKSTGTPYTSAMAIPVVNANPLDPQAYDDDNVESIYSPKIMLSYTPPVPLPVPFPQTLHVEGLPLYMASSVFVRHTLNALYSNLQLILTKVVVNTPKLSPTPIDHNRKETTTQPSSKRRSREKSVLVSFRVTGTARVSKGHGEWEVTSTYSFSPNTGLINDHVVNSIYPAPHQAVYDSLRLSLGKVFGLQSPSAGADGAACTGQSGVGGGNEKQKNR